MNREYRIIAIAHRLSTVKSVDQMYKVKNDEIIESGSHTDLLADERAHADLYTIQSRR
jgi:subfamily B ATP-binding cassette protein MsbA